MINREYWEEACRFFSMTEAEQNLAERLLAGPLEFSAAFGRDMDAVSVAEMEKLLAPVFGHTRREIFLYPVFVSYIKGELPDNANGSLPAGFSLVFPEEETVYGAAELMTELEFLFGGRLQKLQMQGNCMVLAGKEGSAFLARQTAYQTARPLLLWDGSEADASEINLTLLLYNGLLCLDDRQGTVGDSGYKLAQKLCRSGQDLLVLAKDLKTAEKTKEYLTCLVREQKLPDQDAKNRFLQNWVEARGYQADCFLEQRLLGRLGKEEISIAGLHKILEELELEYQLEKMLDDSFVYLPEETCFSVLARRESNSQEMGGIKKLSANKTLEDLCLPEEYHKRLALICQMLKKRDTVLSEWGFADKYSYGNGISILFYGAPGTGKTMAAQVIAAELNLPLYRVDLSVLISKYIGETQKNIAKVFEQTKRLKGILLFDEADALFSRRNEVNDAQDKYANAETAYLLQRIEESDGICILTTNLLQNFDEAFRRRITYMINFPLPDASLRRQLWNRVFPEQTPLSAELDLDLLAENFELSGAAIRNAAMQSAWTAAAQTGEVTMQDVLSGIANEYRKMNKALKPDQKALMELYDAMMF